MPNGEGSGKQEYFTQQTLGKLSGAVGITYMATIVLNKLVRMDQLWLGLIVACVVSIAKWVYDATHGKPVFEPSFSAMKKFGLVILIILMVIFNTFLIFVTATGTSDFVSDLTFDESSLRDGETQTSIAWAGNAQANSEIRYLEESSNQLGTDLTEARTELIATTESLAVAEDELTVLRQTDRGMMLSRVDSLENLGFEYTARIEDLEDLVLTHTSTIEILETEKTELIGGIQEQTIEIESLESEKAELQQQLFELRTLNDSLQVSLSTVIEERTDQTETIERYSIFLQDEYGITPTPEILEIVGP